MEKAEDIYLDFPEWPERRHGIKEVIPYANVYLEAKKKVS